MGNLVALKSRFFVSNDPKDKRPTTHRLDPLILQFLKFPNLWSPQQYIQSDRVLRYDFSDPKTKRKSPLTISSFFTHLHDQRSFVKPGASKLTLSRWPRIQSVLNRVRFRFSFVAQFSRKQRAAGSYSLSSVRKEYHAGRSVVGTVRSATGTPTQQVTRVPRFLSSSPCGRPRGV